ncbi:hypothetical protein VitviT2T_023088 [Vitis vinifera]|uniref:Uncharacterized protein n=1 Tax=Vitis vinifera TaxID=29760 RepID=A0ABY9DBR6_VITVI|nr:hypothetical protein VitviT2T_023088 [Vitis vinifera]
MHGPVVNISSSPMVVVEDGDLPRGLIVPDKDEETQKVVDDLLTNENMIDMEGTQVEIKKAEPKKSSSKLGRTFSFGGDSRTQMYNDDFSGYDSDPYSGLGSGGYGPDSYRALGGIDSRLGDYAPKSPSSAWEPHPSLLLLNLQGQLTPSVFSLLHHQESIWIRGGLQGTQTKAQNGPTTLPKTDLELTGLSHVGFGPQNY